MTLILSGTDGVSDIDGTAATPAIRGTDANTGIFFPAADTIAFAEGGAEAMRINSSGFVGIGTSSPGTKLEVKDGFISTYDATNANGAGYSIRFYTDANAGSKAEVGRIGALQEGAGNNGTIVFATSSSGSVTERMRIDSSGNVGIGTSSPSNVLQVTKNQNATTRISVTNSDSTTTSSRASFRATSAAVDVDITAITGLGGYIGTNTNNPLNLITNGSDRLTIDTSGNVGIGTSSPSTKLHVSDTSTNTVRSRTQASTGYVDVAMVGNSGVFDTTASDGIRLRLSGNDAVSVDSSSNLRFNSGYGSVATAYGCRAWVNFNGTGTVAIRGSGNVTSITDGGVGTYTVNFTNAMPDTNYAPVCCLTRGGLASATLSSDSTWAGTTTTLPLVTTNSANNLIDPPGVFVAVFR